MNPYLRLDGVEMWHVAGWTMVHFLWLGALVGIAAAGCRLVLRRASPDTRYIAATVSLAVLAVLPLGIAGWLIGSSPPFQGGVRGGFFGARENALNGGAAQTVIDRTDFSAEVEMQRFGQLSGTPTSASNFKAIDDLTESSPSPSLRGRGMLVGAIELCVPYLPWVWFVGTPLTLALLATGIVGTERLRCMGQPIAAGPLIEMSARLAKALRVSRRVTIAVCERVCAPVLVGILRPMILLPPAALTGWSPDEIEMVLLHELAHVRRWDNLVNLLQRLVESLLFFHPAVWMVSNWMRRDREACCDAIVVTCTRRPHQYAELLVALAAQMPRSVLFHPVASSAMAAGPLRNRIRYILQLEDDAMLVTGRSFALMLAGLLTAATLAVLYLPTDSQAEESATEATEATEGTEEDLQLAAEEATQKNLKRLIMAIHSNDGNRGSLPANAIYGANGKPLLSWRVHVLPFLAEEKLYREFHLDEPWNSEHNRKLIARMPDVFQNPKLNEPGKTNYLAVVGEECVFNGTPTGLTFSDIRDGTANTIAIVEADEDQAVEWTKPQDWEFVRRDPTKGLGSLWRDHWYGAWVDGSVRRVENSQLADVVGIQFTRAGREINSLSESTGGQAEESDTENTGESAENREKEKNAESTIADARDEDGQAKSESADSAVDLEPSWRVQVEGVPVGNENVMAVRGSQDDVNAFIKQTEAGVSRKPQNERRVLGTFTSDNDGLEKLVRAVDEARGKNLYVDIITKGTEWSLVVVPEPTEADWPAMLGDPPRKNRVIADKAWQRLGLKVVPTSELESFEFLSRGLAGGPVKILGGNVPKGLPLPAFLRRVGGNDLDSFDDLHTWLINEENKRPALVKVYAFADGHEYLFEAKPIADEEPAPPQEPKPKFPPLEDQKLADLAYRRLNLELEPLDEEDSQRVKALGYDGGIWIAQAAGTAEGRFLEGDILVGLHVWPTTSLKDVAEILNREDLVELVPLKFYVIRRPSNSEKDVVVTGRISVNLEPSRQEGDEAGTDAPARARSTRTTPGRNATIGDKDAIQKLNGTVSAVQRKDGATLIEFSIGADDGLREGMTVGVYRGDKYLASVEVLTTSPDRAVGRVDKHFDQGPINKGDRVSVGIAQGMAKPQAPSEPRGNNLVAASESEIKVLQDHIKTLQSQFERLDALFKTGARGGTPDNRALAAYELAAAKGELALAQGQHAEAIERFNEAQSHAQDALNAFTAAYNVGNATYDVVVTAAKNLANIKRKIIQLQSERPDSNPAASAANAAAFETTYPSAATSQPAAAPRSSESISVLKKIVEREGQKYNRLAKLAQEGKGTTAEAETQKSDYEISLFRLRQAERALEYHRAQVAMAAAEYEAALEASKRSPHSVPELELRKLQLKVQAAEAMYKTLAE